MFNIDGKGMPNILEEEPGCSVTSSRFLEGTLSSEIQLGTVYVLSTLECQSNWTMSIRYATRVVYRSILPLLSASAIGLGASSCDSRSGPCNYFSTGLGPLCLCKPLLLHKLGRYPCSSYFSASFVFLGKAKPGDGRSSPIIIIQRNSHKQEKGGSTNHGVRVISQVLRFEDYILIAKSGSISRC